jgi:ankyrin repeat protein
LYFPELSPSSPVPGKPKDRNERGETALHICAKKGDLEGAKKLLDQNIDPNTTDFAGKRILNNRKFQIS